MAQRAGLGWGRALLEGGGRLLGEPDPQSVKTPPAVLQLLLAALRSWPEGPGAAAGSPRASLADAAGFAPGSPYQAVPPGAGA